jgi:hypothetical protein
MNAEQLIRLIGRRFLGQLINRGINAGIDRTAANRKQAQQAKQTTRRARQAMRALRRFGRF